MLGGSVHRPGPHRSRGCQTRHRRKTAHGTRGCPQKHEASKTLTGQRAARICCWDASRLVEFPRMWPQNPRGTRGCRTPSGFPASLRDCSWNAFFHQTRPCWEGRFCSPAQFYRDTSLPGARLDARAIWEASTCNRFRPRVA